MTMITAKDGAKLYVEETGEGTPILFIHEFGGNHESWEPQLRYFSRRSNDPFGVAETECKILEIVGCRH